LPLKQVFEFLAIGYRDHYLKSTLIKN